MTNENKFGFLQMHFYAYYLIRGVCDFSYSLDIWHSLQENDNHFMLVTGKFSQKLLHFDHTDTFSMTYVVYKNM